MYEEFTNLFTDIEKKVEEGNIIIEGDVNINIIDDGKAGSPPGKKAIKTLRNSAAMKTWRKRIIKRDQAECQCCHKIVQDGIEVHHIFPLAKNPDLGHVDGNGIALCTQCHSKYHQMYQGSEDPQTFAKFLRDFGNRRS